jgi:hypothetical protein
LPGAVSAAALAARTYQPADGPEGLAPEVVDLVMAGRRLEGWALWCELSAIAHLVQHWSAYPIDDESNDELGLSAGDPARAERLAQQLDAAQRSARSRVPQSAEMAHDFVAAEISLATGLTRPAAADRVLAAEILIVSGELPRTAQLLRAGLLDWPKVQLLTRRLGMRLTPAGVGCREASHPGCRPRPHG